MLKLMVLTAMNWLAFYPDVLYDIDWVGSQVYDGAVNTQMNINPE